MIKFPILFFVSFSCSVCLSQSNSNYLLDISSNEGNSTTFPRHFLRINNTNNSEYSNVALLMEAGTGDNHTRASIGLNSYNYNAIEDLSGFSYIYDFNNGITLRAASDNGIIRFISGGAPVTFERMRITSNGNVGIGSIEPASKLQITNGDIYISDISKGVIMKSGNGKCWRYTPDDIGDLMKEEIDCPESN